MFIWAITHSTEQLYLVALRLVRFLSPFFRDLTCALGYLILRLSHFWWDLGCAMHCKRCRILWSFFPLSKPQSISLFLFSSPGIYEAVELRDGGKDYLGKGVTKVRVFAIFPFVCGWNIVCSFVSLRFFPLSLRLRYGQVLIFKAAPEAILVANVLLILPMSCEKWACHRTVSYMLQYWSQAAFSFVLGRLWTMSTPSLDLPLLAR